MRVQVRTVFLVKDSSSSITLEAHNHGAFVRWAQSKVNCTERFILAMQGVEE
jgi:hypothetical protein